MLKKIKLYKKFFLKRNKFCIGDRNVFYEELEKYLPDDNKLVVLDIGAGDGSFARVLDLKNKNLDFALLDGNKFSVDRMNEEFSGHAILYNIPEKLPYDDESVSFIHCSHVIEHLDSEMLYSFLKEIDRVLSSNGLLVVSSPLLWNRFYDDLSHIKPYNPSVLIKYLSSNKNLTTTRKKISNKYETVDCIYRYRVQKVNDYNFWGSKYFLVDLFFYCFKIFLSKTGFRRYVKNGYTIVLKKQS